MILSWDLIVDLIGSAIVWVLVIGVLASFLNIGSKKPLTSCFTLKGIWQPTAKKEDLMAWSAVTYTTQK